MGPVSLEIDPQLHQPSFPVPGNLTRDQILDTLVSFSIDGGTHGELENYAREDCDRFLHTLSLVPEGPLRILEIGANPYFLTYLLKQFRPDAELTLLNYFGGDAGIRDQTLTVKRWDGEIENFSLQYHNVNIEESELPFADGSFDLVLYCEVIEHMLNDPLATLLRVKRVLRHDGWLVLTTPNVARLENVARLIAGANIYDPYSGYGPYGRHNREYNRHELHHLLRYAGFAEEVCFTADVHPNHAADFVDPRVLGAMLRLRATDLGQYLFTRQRNAGPAPDRLPGWLYRSYPPERIDPSETL
jgi:SAM-dependent methyltransferase